MLTGGGPNINRGICVKKLNSFLSLNSFFFFILYFSLFVKIVFGALIRAEVQHKSSRA
jgi:hypothetical protein